MQECLLLRKQAIKQTISKKFGKYEKRREEIKLHEYLEVEKYVRNDVNHKKDTSCFRHS